MKTVLIPLMMLVLVSCMGGTSSGQVADAKLDTLLLEHNWRSTVSCDLNPGCTFKALSIHPDGLTFTIIDYTKVDVTQDPASAILNNESFDFHPVGTMSGIATSRVDPNVQRLVVATYHSAGRYTFCIDSVCAIYDQLDYGDL